MLARLNLKPRYSHKDGVNKVTIPVPLKPKKNGLLRGIFSGVLLAVLTWLLSTIMPESVRDGFLVPAVHNTFGKFSDIFSALATPLVFFAVITGICGIGEVSAFGKIGGKLLKRRSL